MRCATCVYRFDCHGPCVGYEPDEETVAGRDDWAELQADIERNEADGEDAQ